MKYIQAQRKIMTMIAHEGMLVDDKLPDEKSLSEVLEVSAITTRRALKELSKLGIIERKQGSGTFVKKELSKKKLSGTLGFLLISETDFNSMDVRCNNSLITKIQEECGKYGYDLRGMSFGKDSCKAADKELADVSGIFISGKITDSWISYLKGIDLPFVVLGETFSDIPVSKVSFDWKKATGMLAFKLIRKGAKKIAFLNGGAKSYTASLPCYEGYKETLLKNDLIFAEDWIAWCSKKEYNKKIAEFFEHNDGIKFDAIIVEEGVFPHLISYMYNVDYPRQIPVGILGNNLGLFTGKHLFQVGFSDLFSEHGVKELMHKLTNPGSENKTIFLKPSFVE